MFWFLTCLFTSRSRGKPDQTSQFRVPERSGELKSNSETTYRFRPNNYFERIAMIILPYAGLVMITPTSTPSMVTMANPRRVERSINASGSIAINMVAADAMIIPSALFSRLR